MWMISTGTKGDPPSVAVAQGQNVGIGDALEERDSLVAALEHSGALLLRGLANDTRQAALAQFMEFVELFSGPPLDYEERSSPRHEVGDRIFTATDHPASLPIFPHNEQSYNLTFPGRLHFLCLQPAERGGATTLVDSRSVLARIPDRLRGRLERDGYLYARTLRKHMGLPWQDVFQTEDSAVAERYCADNDIQLTWLADDEARTVQRRDVIAQHPVTHEKSWFNHCAFFHVSTLGPDNASTLRELFGENGLPNQTYYGDGESIDDSDAGLLRDAYTAGLREVDWNAGDILVVDNILVSHGRAPYVGERNVVVAMTSPLTWSDVRPGAGALP